MYVDWEVFGEGSLISKTGKHNKHNVKIRINSKDPKDKKIAELNKKLKWLEMDNEVLKKFNELMEDSKKIIKYYKTIVKYNSKYTVLSLCKLFNVTRASYYRWCGKNKPDYETNIDMDLAYKIKNIFRINNGIYGAPRIKIILNNQGIVVSQSKVARIMKLFILYSVIRIKKLYRKPKEVKKITYGPNHVNRNWSLYSKNELWVTDITYIPFNKKFAYYSFLKTQTLDS